jgi:hypothetical protein
VRLGYYKAIGNTNKAWLIWNAIVKSFVDKKVKRRDMAKSVKVVLMIILDWAFLRVDILGCECQG